MIGRGVEGRRRLGSVDPGADDGRSKLGLLVVSGSNALGRDPVGRIPLGRMAAEFSMEEDLTDALRIEFRAGRNLNTGIVE
jgi:hypothetical protein